MLGPALSAAQSTPHSLSVAASCMPVLRRRIGVVATLSQQGTMYRRLRPDVKPSGPRPSRRSQRVKLTVPPEHGESRPMPDSETTGGSPWLVEMTELVLPEDTNTWGTIFGGRVLALVDKCAAIGAMRHARMPVLTAAMDSIEFRNPVQL